VATWHRDGRHHTWEIENIKKDLDSLPFPVHVIPGNMDTGNKCTGLRGPDPRRCDPELNIRSSDMVEWKKVFGPGNWSFVHKNVRFSGFCDMLLGSGLPEEDNLWKWLESQRNEPRTEYHVWIMHYALFIDRLDEPNWDITRTDQYLQWYFGISEPHRSRLFQVFKATGADLVITGHIHCAKTHLAEGIHFDLAPATCSVQFEDHWADCDPRMGFTRYRVASDGISGTFVPLSEISEREGFGPGGHPRPQARDYSIARQQWPGGGAPPHRD
jgi:Calcineurin-like phosphoesterase